MSIPDKPTHCMSGSESACVRSPQLSSSRQFRNAVVNNNVCACIETERAYMSIEMKLTSCFPHDDFIQRTLCLWGLLSGTNYTYVNVCADN